MKLISIVPQPLCPGTELLSNLWVMVPVVGLVPVLTPYTFLQVGHCRNGEGELAMRADRQAEWKECLQSTRVSTGARVVLE